MTLEMMCPASPPRRLPLGCSTPLLWAVKNGNRTAVSKLLACRGVNINAADHYGATSLICAAKAGDAACMELLLAATPAARPGGDAEDGLRVNATDQHGTTALIWAARMGSTSCLQLLLSYAGVDVNAASDTGLTAMHAAAVKDNLQNVRLLLAAGASLEAADQHGQTVLCLAVKRSDMRLVQLLWGWQQQQLLQLQQEVQEWRAMPVNLTEAIALFAGHVPCETA